MTAGVCYDWSPVRYASHPIPGDPELVASSATAFHRTSDHLREAASGLRRLDGADLDSDATRALWSNAREVAGLLEQAFDRYEQAAGALAGYAPVLARAKADAEAALQAATSASRDYSRSSSQANSMLEGANSTIDPVQRQEFLSAFHQAKAHAENADANVHAARARIEAAIRDRDAAATRAAAQIHDTVSGRELNDDLMDQLRELYDNIRQFTSDLLANNPILKAFVDLMKSAALWVWEHIGEIALGLQIASLLLGWVPVLGQVLAVLAGIAKALALVKSLVDLGPAISTGLSTGDWSGFATEALVLGAGLLVSKGISKGLSKFFDAKRFAPLVKARDRVVVNQGFDKAYAGFNSTNATRFPSIKQYLGLSHAPGSRQAITDNLIDQLKGGGLYARDIQHSAFTIDLAEGAANVVADQIVDDIKDRVLPEHPPVPPRHRVCEQALSTGAGV